MGAYNLSQRKRVHLVGIRKYLMSVSPLEGACRKLLRQAYTGMEFYRNHKSKAKWWRSFEPMHTHNAYTYTEYQCICIYTIPMHTHSSLNELLHHTCMNIIFVCFHAEYFAYGVLHLSQWLGCWRCSKIIEIYVLRFITHRAVLYVSL